MQITSRLLQEADYQLLSDRESVAFPTDVHGSLMHLYPTWFQSGLNLSHIFESADKPVGLIAVIPVNKKGWEFIHDQSTEDLDEEAILDDMVFDPAQDQEVGLYVYMIEKLDKEIKGFSQIAYTQMFRALMQTPAGSKAKLLGVSGYAVSLESIHVALNVMNRNEYRSVNAYMAYDPEGRFVTKNVSTQDELEELMQKGYTIRNRCRILTVNRDDPSVVWSWLKAAQNS